MNFNLPLLAPSILASNYRFLDEQIQLCLNSDIQWLHCDIMDGHFVPNISYGPDFVAAVRESAPTTFLDVHLMIEHPDHFIEDFADAGADLISVHYEACPHLHRTIQKISETGCMTGVVVNPATSVELLEPIFPFVDLVLLMSVNPGFGGQSFIEQTYRKLEQLQHLKRENQASFLVEIDGGVGLKNIQKLVVKGADILVAGSSVFKAKDIPSRITQLTNLASKSSSKKI